MFDLSINRISARAKSGRRRVVRGLGLGLVLVMVSGCAASFRNHGYVPSEDDLSEIVVGVDTRSSVDSAVGAPSIAGVLDQGGYYYIQSRVRHFAFYKPEVVEREVVAISFTAADTVANIERFSLADGKIVPLSRRVTSSSIQNNGFLRQLLGNLGRFTAGNFLN